jgi:hypothetical protein
MTARARHAAFAVVLSVSTAIVATAPATAREEAPDVQTQAPTAVTTASAVLHGLVNPRTRKTTYWFEVGTTVAYGTSTAVASAGKGDKPVTVTAAVGGLVPATTYHLRLVASSDRGVTAGDDVTFATLAATGQGSGGPLPTPAAPSPLPGTELAPAPAAAPVLEASVAIAPANGSVLVRVPGATHAAALSSDASIPVGSIVDTRHGSVKLRAALPGGATQTGTFHGGLFEVRQAAGARGMTELVLRGPKPTCTGAGTARAAAASARRPPRGLWGRDDHGRFRTRGSNSVATVRGTAWYVEDRCDGTLTRVSKGSVSVRDLRRERTVIVHAGDSYLARSGR